jgi:hypothetical protein
VTVTDKEMRIALAEKLGLHKVDDEVGEDEYSVEDRCVTFGCGEGYSGFWVEFGGLSLASTGLETAYRMECGND